jgi:hypothetical protein
MSTAETIRTLKSLTPDELRRVLREAGGTGRSGLEQSLGAMPKGVPLGMLMHASAITTSVCDPQPGILSYLRDSDEGKPVERQEIAGAGGGAVKVEYNLKMTFPSRKEHAASEPKPGDAAKPAGG